MTPHCGSATRPKGGAMTAYRFYVGIDWATEAHRVVVLDADRRSLHDRTVRHEGVALETFAHWLAQDGAAGVARDVAAAPEAPRAARSSARCRPGASTAP